MKFKTTIIYILILFSLAACEKDPQEGIVDPQEKLIDQIVGSYEVEEHWVRRHFSVVSADRNYVSSSSNYDTLVIERSDVEFFDIWIWELLDGRRVGASLSDSIPDTFESPNFGGFESLGPGRFILKEGVLEFEYLYSFQGSLSSDSYEVEGSGTKINP